MERSSEAHGLFRESHARQSAIACPPPATGARRRPAWLAGVAWNREALLHVAIVVPCPRRGQRFFKLLYAKQNPYLGVFVELELLPVAVPRARNAEELNDLAWSSVQDTAFARRFSYAFAPEAFLGHWQLPARAYEEEVSALDGCYFFGREVVSNEEIGPLKDLLVGGREPPPLTTPACRP